MYANSYGGTSPSPGMSNNPFVEDPTTAHTRFPDLNASSFTGYPDQHPQYLPQYHPQSYAPGGPYQPQPQVMVPQSQFTSTSYAPQYQGHITPQPTSIGAFHPSASFSQQHAYPPSNYPTGMPMTYSASGTAYPAPPTNATPSYLAEFDPYTQTHQRQQQSQSPQPGMVQGGGGIAPPGVVHPRDVIRTHKSGLEAWDTYSWKQLLGACDTLKEAWAARKQQAEGVVRQYGGVSDPGLFGPDPAFGYNGQVEGWKQVLKDANDHFDTVAACTFQLHEVFNSYRQSADPASKRRVRESCNAAVKGLPDWPSN